MKQNLSDKIVTINFSSKVIFFFILLEGLTVPLVAMSNNISAHNIIYTGVMGFIVATVCVLFLFKILKKLILKHSQNIFGIEIAQINGIFLIGIMAGVLLMVMFLVQFILFSHNANDYVAGFLSGFFSVFITLCLYEIFSRINIFAIKIRDNKKTIFQIHFKFKDIFLLSLIFAIYELIVCPITGIWIPFTTWRIPMAILSGIIGGGVGGTFLYLTTSFLKLKPFIHLKR